MAVKAFFCIYSSLWIKYFLGLTFKHGHIIHFLFCTSQGSFLEIHDIFCH